MNVSSATVETLVLDAGQSSELAAAFSLVADTDIDGEPRFSPKVCHELKKVIVCRTYTTPVLELCHLVRIADACSNGAGYEMFFWGGGAARASAFRAQATMAGDLPLCEVDENGVNAFYPDGRFSVSFGRMPFLSAFMEFLITALGYETVDGALRPITEADVTAEIVSAQANGLSKSIYNYLKEHLPAVQAQRKFRRLISFMEDEKGADFQLGDVDDECIMAFWERVSGEAGDGGADFKTFAAAFKAFVRLGQVLEHALDLHGLERAQPIGSDRDAGEIDPERLSELLDDVSEELNPLLALCDGPAAAIKFLNKREFEALETLFESGRTGLGMPLSLMRCEAFGKGQGRITQALRRKARGGELLDLIENCAALTFEEKGEELRKLVEHLERVLLASLHALLCQRDKEALSLMLALAPDADLSPLKSLIGEIADEEEEAADSNVVLLRPEGVAAAVIEAAADPALVGDDLANLARRSDKAFDGLSRQGFGRDDANDPEVQEGFVEGARHLVRVREHVRAFVEKLETTDLPEGGWVPQFDADRSRFARQFQVLYGETL